MTRIPFKHTKTGYQIGDMEFPRLNGLWIIRQLLMNPGKEISANQLRSEQMEAGEIFDDMNQMHQMKPQPIYSRREVSVLSAHLEEKRECVSCPADHDEIDWLEKTLEQAAYKDKRTGDYIKPKKFNDDGERSRQTVNQNIKNALNALAANPHITAIAIELRNDIKTGRFCSYQGKQKWQFT
jgi:hypothetical protein